MTAKHATRGVEHHTPFETYVSMAEIAHITNTSLRTIRQWRAGGFLPSPDIDRGRVLRWKRATIYSWLSNDQGRDE